MAVDSKPENYYQNAREEMLAFIPVSARTVLEVGCGEGHFGRLLKRPDREVWGVEVEAEHALVAERQLDRVLVGDVAMVVRDLPEAYFDLVVFNDVLEHLVDPFRILTDVRGNLRDGGVVVSSIPNIRYYPIAYNLIVRGNWEYEESGILDLTHLRFFTFASIQNMYRRLGFEVLRHEGINPMPVTPLRYRIANAFLRGRLSDMAYMQFATVARPVPGARSRSWEPQNP